MAHEEVAGTFRAAAVTRMRAVVKIAGRGRCRATADGLQLDGYAATTVWAWTLALLVVIAAVAVAGLAHARLPGAPAVEDIAPPLVLLGLLPLMSLDALPTRRPRALDVRWQRIASIAPISRRGVGGLRIEIEDLGTVDFFPDEDPHRVYVALHERRAASALLAS